MTVIISGTDGVSDVDGTAGTPALRGTDANTGIFFGADQVGVATNGVERVEFGNSVTVFNDGGADVDFRVEGDTDANLLCVDASTDRVGVGTNAPNLAKFQVNGSGPSNSIMTNTAATLGSSNFVNIGDDGTDALIGVGNSSTNLSLLSRASGVYTKALTVNADTTITFNAYGAGTLSTSAAGVISASDGRYKTKTRLVENGLEAIAALQPTYFRWNEDSPFASEYEELGFVAQEVAAVIPEASPGEDEEGRYRNYYDRAIIAMMVKSIQELSAKNDALEARIAALEAQ